MQRALPICLVLSLSCTSSLEIRSNEGGQSFQQVNVVGGSAGEVVSFDARESATPAPASYDPTHLITWVRHMGLQYGPTQVKQTGTETRFVIDTDDLYARGYFPFTQEYCQRIGKGGPQVTAEQHVSENPWSEENGTLTFSVDVELSSSRSADLAPVFQSSFYMYLSDGAHSVAVLFNLYDPRGSYTPGVHNDGQVFFFTAPFGAGGDDLFTVLSGAHHASSFGYETFSIRIDATQMRALLERLRGTQALSLDPKKLRLTSVGLLNEMNFFYRPPPAGDCEPDFDPATHARAELAYKNFTVDLGAGPQPVYSGALDGVTSAGLVTGHAELLGSSEPLTVRLSAGGQVLADVKASPRFEYQATDAQLSTLGGQTVHAEVLDSTTQLSGAPTLPVQQQQQQMPAQPAAFDGVLEGVLVTPDNRIIVQGWACVAGSSEVVTVDLGFRTVTADAWSPDLGVVCAGAPGQHRFEAVLSGADLMALGTSDVSARATDSHGRTLTLRTGAWPQKAPTFDGALDGVQADGRIDGWACAAERDGAVTVTLRAGGQVIAEAIANVPAEAAVGARCRSGSAHRFIVTPSLADRAAHAGQQVEASIEAGGVTVCGLEKYAGVNYAVQ